MGRYDNSLHVGVDTVSQGRQAPLHVAVSTRGGVGLDRCSDGGQVSRKKTGCVSALHSPLFRMERPREPFFGRALGRRWLIRTPARGSVLCPHPTVRCRPCWEATDSPRNLAALSLSRLWHEFCPRA